MFHRIEHVLKGGLGVPGANVTVYLTGTTTKATLYATNDTSQPIPNPTSTDANGRYAYFIANGSYDETVVYGSITATETYIQMYDLSAPVIAAASWGSISGTITAQTDLQAALAGKQAAGSYLTGIGANSVTRAMLAQTAGATILGATAAGNVADLTAAQAKTFLAIAGGDVTLGVRNTSTSDTPVLADANGWVRFTGASAQVFTIPPNSAVAYPIGTEISFSQAGAGGVTVAAGAGVTINSRGALVALAGQYGVGAVKQVAANTWVLTGDLA